MAEREALTAEYVRQILDYNPETGVFTWRERPREHFAISRIWRAWNTKFSGKVAGYIGPVGYAIVAINNHYYWLHRIAWLYIAGKWPDHEIDHINGIRSDNRFSNLRVATRAENGRNCRRKATNSSGYKGVSLVRGKW